MFCDAVVKYKKSVLIYNELGVVFFMVGEKEVVILIFEKVIKLDVRLFGVWVNFVEVLCLMGCYKKVVLSYYCFLKLKKGDCYVVYGLVFCFEGYEVFDKVLWMFNVVKKWVDDDFWFLVRVNIVIKWVWFKFVVVKLLFLECGDVYLFVGCWV